MALEQSTFPELALHPPTPSPSPPPPPIFPLLLMCDRHLRWLTWPSHFIPQHSQVLGKYFETVWWWGVRRETNVRFTSTQKVFIDSEILISKFSMSKTIPNHNNAELQTGLPNWLVLPRLRQGEMWHVHPPAQKRRWCSSAGEDCSPSAASAGRSHGTDTRVLLCSIGAVLLGALALAGDAPHLPGLWISDRAGCASSLRKNKFRSCMQEKGLPETYLAF